MTILDGLAWAFGAYCLGLATSGRVLPALDRISDRLAHWTARKLGNDKESLRYRL